MNGQHNRHHIARAFGAALRNARVEQGLSQDMLSQLCDFDRTYPRLLERGLRAPTLATLLRIADALGVAPERLLGETVARLRREAT